MFSKKLDTRQSEILTNFHEIACLIPLRTQDICLAISSNCTYCFRLKVEVTVELAHMVKYQCFRHFNRKYSSSDALSQLLMNIHRNYQWNLTRILVFVQNCQAILNRGFVSLWTNSPRLHSAYSLETWLTGTVFKILPGTYTLPYMKHILEISTFEVQISGVLEAFSQRRQICTV